MIFRSSGWSSLETAVAATLFVAVAWALNGHLAVFTDTMAYVRQGEFWATHLHLGAPLSDPPPHSEHMSLMPSALARYGPLPTTIAAARSPFYGLFLYVVGGIGSLWAVVFIQALVAAWLLRVTTRLMLPAPSDTAYWLLISILTLGTSLPFFVNFAMPDIFGGFGYLAAILLVVASDRLSSRDRFCLWLLVTAAILFHRANAPTLLLIAIVGGCQLKRNGWTIGKSVGRTGVIMSSLLVAVLGIALMQDAFRRETGYTLGSPPFLMGRVLLDGPGKEYLDRLCPAGVSPTLCRFKDRPMLQEDDVLWRPEDGVFGSADYTTRRQLQSDEIAFVVASIRFDPWRTLQAELQNWWLQTLLIFVEDPLASPSRILADPGTDAAALRHLLPTLRPCSVIGGCQTISIPTLRWALIFVHVPVLLVSMLVLGRAGVSLTRRLNSYSRGGKDAKQLRMVLDTGYLILIAILSNAACFGVLSGPFPRYQARLVWLIPMAAVLSSLVERRFAMSRTSLAEEVSHARLEPRSKPFNADCSPETGR